MVISNLINAFENYLQQILMQFTDSSHLK